MTYDQLQQNMKSVRATGTTIDRASAAWLMAEDLIVTVDADKGYALTPRGRLALAGCEEINAAAEVFGAFNQSDIRNAFRRD